MTAHTPNVHRSYLFQFQMAGNALDFKRFVQPIYLGVTADIGDMNVCSARRVNRVFLTRGYAYHIHNAVLDFYMYLPFTPGRRNNLALIPALEFKMSADIQNTERAMSARSASC
jgi:hypothetical protein